MAVIDDLIAQVGDDALRARLAREWAHTREQRRFGLVFEEHLPELLVLPQEPVRRGSAVCLRDDGARAVWRVQDMAGDMARLQRSAGGQQEQCTAPLADLQVVLPFGEPIFPALEPVDSVQNGAADAPWHTLIEADNYHALQLLGYLYAGQVDCIYIDPPYNTGARDFKLATQLNVAAIAPEAPAQMRSQIIGWIDAQLAAMRADGRYDEALKGVIKVRLSRLVVQGQGASHEEGSEYEIGTSDVDIERHFGDAGRLLGHGLHLAWLDARVAEDMSNLRDAKLDLAALARSKHAMQALQKTAAAAFDELYDRHKLAIGKLPEAERLACQRLLLAASEPVPVDWRLPPSIQWRRKLDEPLWDRHLYVEESGPFRTALGGWEAPVLQQELDQGARWWLRNTPRQPWALEIPYRKGGVVMPMYPDLVVLHPHGDELVASILEPHDPGRDDNFEKAVGLAEFAGKYGHLLDRIELIRKQAAASGGKMFKRLNLNRETVRQKVLLVTSNPQLDAVFKALAI